MAPGKLIKTDIVNNEWFPGPRHLQGIGGKNKKAEAQVFFISLTLFKGKLAHTFTSCYLECIAYHLMIDKTFITEKN